MTREEARKAAEIMLAYANGEKIEVNSGDEWIEANGNCSFNWSVFNYRIKPKPQYRPFKTTEECWNEMLKHHPFGWIRDNYTNTYKNITLVHSNKVELTPYFTYDGENLQDMILYKDTIKRYTFADGKPFGIKED